MKHQVRNLFGILVTATIVCGAFSAFAAQSPNPRGTSSSGAVARTKSSNDSGVVPRAAVVSRAAKTRDNAGASGRISARGAVTSNAIRGAAGGARSAVPISRSATVARSAMSPAGSSSRASLARATAVFSDVSKIGGSYASCRDAYATCMDQFCATANDKYRRCFCSSRFAEFRDIEDNLDQAKTLLMQFEDNNLNAIDKTAAEVTAMYSATVGESAIKKDTSGAAKILNQIGNLLSGKTKTTTNSYSSGSLGVLSLDITDDIDDIWGGSSSSGGSAFSIFNGGSAQNLAELEGTSLYNASNKQCQSMVADICETNAVLQMARSAYSIMITQDCNTYEKKIESQRESVKQVVRTAEKYLREARLEEYRAHNSTDVNECIAQVKKAITADTACGDNYKRCLDMNTGVYINANGDPIYSPRFFKLTDLIKLDGAGSDILDQNPDFDKYLDSKRIYASSALDSCRSIADTVWTEFKNSALIEIAQAQDEAIESVRMSCVSTMAQCYDKQTSDLRDFDATTAQAAGAVSVYAARQMCADKVIACASLYGDTDGCSFDGNGKLVTGNNGKRCGIDALLNFVDAVDTSRVAEGCETALKNYATSLCTPTNGEVGYPWGCRLLDPGTIRKSIDNKAEELCNVKVEDDNLKINYKTVASNLYYDIFNELSSMMYTQCKSLNGRWYAPEESGGKTDYEPSFYLMVYGTTAPKPGFNTYGVCIRNTVRYACENQDVVTGGKGYAQYNATSDTCTLSNEWYQYKCENVLDGYWENGTCYTK